MGILVLYKDIYFVLQQSLLISSTYYYNTMVANKIKINLEDLPDKVYVKLEKEFRERFFLELIECVGGKLLLAKMLGFKKSDSITVYQKAKYWCPLSLIKEISFILCKGRSWFNEIEKHIIEIRYGYRRAKGIKNPQFSFVLSNELGCLIGHLLGDGGIGMGSSVYVPFYTNNSLTLLEEFKICLTLFGHVPCVRFKHHNAGHIVFPSILGVFLFQIFGNFIKQEKIVPNVVLNSDKSCKLAFLRALFDDEGCVNISSYTIQIRMSSKHIMENIKKMLEGFDIKTGRMMVETPSFTKRKIQYRFLISGRQNLEKFHSLIGFSHTDKEKKLQILFSNYKQKHPYGKGQIKKLMIDVIQNKKRIKTSELAYELKRLPRGRFHKHLGQLEKENKINWDKKGGFIYCCSLT